MSRSAEGMTVNKLKEELKALHPDMVFSVNRKGLKRQQLADIFENKADYPRKVSRAGRPVPPEQKERSLARRQETAEAKAPYTDYTVAQLKERAKELKIPHTGKKKKDLLSAILSEELGRKVKVTPPKSRKTASPKRHKAKSPVRRASPSKPKPAPTRIELSEPMEKPIVVRAPRARSTAPKAMIPKPASPPRPAGSSTSSRSVPATTSTHTEAQLKAMTVKDLQNLAGERKLLKKGPKADLVARILSGKNE